MIAYKQTILGRGEKFKEPAGDCFATCVASVLDLPREQVPNFCEHENWWFRLQEWLLPLGFFYIDIAPSEGEKDDILSKLGWCVISGDSPRGCKHSVVGFAGKMVHDPHPSNAGLVTEELFGVFVALQPQLQRGDVDAVAPWAIDQRPITSEDLIIARSIVRRKIRPAVLQRQMGMSYRTANLLIEELMAEMGAKAVND